MMCLYFFLLKCEVFTMQKLKMKTTKTFTFEEGCNKYLEYCRQRNLRQPCFSYCYQIFYKGGVFLLLLRFRSVRLNRNTFL